MARARRPRLRNVTAADGASLVGSNVREQLFMLISQIAYHRERQLDAEVARLGLSLQLWRCMVVIHRILDCSMTDLSRFGLADRTTLTRSVDQLVARGLADRYVSPEDRRLVLLRLTQEGERLFDQAIEITFRVNSEILANAPGVDRAGLADQLENVLSGLLSDPDDLEDVVSFGRPRPGPQV